MADVEVRQGPNGPEHKHKGYPAKGEPEWHPVSQKHKGNLHANLGITGKEKPNRRNAETIGVKPEQAKAPQRAKNVGTGGRPMWSWDGSASVGDFLKAYANMRPRTAIGRTIVTAVNATSWMVNAFQKRMAEKDAQYALKGYENALRAFDERFEFHGEDDFDKLTADDIRRIDKDLTEMARAKFEEYGGADLKGKRDPESLERKAEIKTYLELVDKLRERAKAEGENSRQSRPRRTGPQSTRTSEGQSTGGVSARDLRRRRNQNG